MSPPSPHRVELELGFEGALETVTVELPPGEAIPWDARSKLDLIGKDHARIDGPFKVDGRARYTLDVDLPGMLHAAVLRCPLPAATLVRIDLERARTMPGVRAVLAIAAPGDPLLFAGQDVAAVAATTLAFAREALEAIVVEYASRPFVTDTLSAAKPAAPIVHRGSVDERRTDGDEPGERQAEEAQGNVRPQAPMQRGNVDRALARAAVVHEATYSTQVQTHNALEPHGLVVRWDDRDRMTVWCSTQGIFSVRDEMAEVFGVPPANVHVITEFLGGGFGAKFGASAPGTRLGTIAGTLAKDAGAPVKLMCDRREEQTCTGNRPDAHQAVRIGADKTGKLAGIHVVAHGTAGIGTGAGIGRSAFSVYAGCPNVRVEASDVFTNAGPATAMRAPGHPQGAFAIELAIDELAVKLGTDPLALRIAHDHHPLRRRQFELGRERFEWDSKRAASARQRANGARIRRGYGVAASTWGDFGRAKAVVATCSIYRDGTIEVKNGVQDIGGGITTVLALVAAEVFHRPLASVRVKIGDSEHGPSVGSGGSHTTSSVTPAVRNACEQAKLALGELAATRLGVPPAALTWDAHGTVRGGGTSLDWTTLCKAIDGEAIVATGTRPATYGAHPRRFMDRDVPEIAGVQFAEVEVDTWTGIVRAEHVLALHDCGRVMNGLATRSQVNGGVILGTSYALLEERVMDHTLGVMLNANLESYKIAGALDIPRIDVVLTPVHAGNNNTGAIGIGEPATIPTAAAIACAVFDALGVAVRTLPMTPARVLSALAEAERTAVP